MTRKLEFKDFWEARLILGDKIYDLPLLVKHKYGLDFDNDVEFVGRLPSKFITEEVYKELLLKKSQLILGDSVYDFPIHIIHSQPSLKCVELSGKLALEIFNVEVNENKEEELELLESEWEPWGKEELEEEIDILQYQLEDKEDELDKAYEEIFNLEEQICDLQDELMEYEDEIEELNLELSKYKSKKIMDFAKLYSEICIYGSYTPLYDSQGKLRGLLYESGKFTPLNHIGVEI